MNKEIITNKQGISIIVLFILGSSIVLSPGGRAKQDAWIAIIIALLIALPSVFVYSRLLSIYPEKKFFDILQDIFGKKIAKGVSILFVGYSFHLGALVLRNFSEFITIVSVPDTPQMIITILLGIVCIIIAKSGIELLGRWANFILPFLLFIIFATVVLVLPDAHFSNMMPILYNGFGPVLKGAFATYTFPLAETVILCMVFCSIKTKFNVYKVYYIGLSIGTCILLLISIRNVLVLGAELVATTYFPSYTSVSIINILNFFQRIEVLVSATFLFAGIVKISACLLAASQGVSYILSIPNYRSVVVPIAFLMMNLSYIIYKNSMEMFEWAKNIYPLYAIPFQIIIPLFILLCAEVKNRTKTRNRNNE